MKCILFLVSMALLMLLPFGMAHGANEITLDHVTNVTGGDTVITDGYIPVGDTAKFTFRWTYEDGTKNIGAFANGFQVYEKNGGDFFPITWDTVAGAGLGSRFISIFFNDFSVSGTGRDTIGFGGFAIFPGVEVGYDSAVWYITSGSDNAGDTVCIDSSYYPPGGTWAWSWMGGGTFKPDWSGPYCYLIKDSVEVQPELVLTPDTLHFTAVEAGANPAADSFEVSETGGFNIAFAVAETAGWFDLNKTGGTTPEYVTVNADITGLAPGTYFDSVEVSSGEAVNSPQFAYVALEVTPAPKYLAVNPDTLHFTAVEGGTNPPADSFEVSETGGFNIAFAVAETADWFGLNKTSGTTPEQVTVDVDITGLSTGVYLDSVTVSSGEADNTPQFAYVRLEVTAAPKYLAVNPDTLHFTAVEGGTNPPADSFEVSETGGFAIAFNVAETVGWFDLNKTGGTTPEYVTVNADITGLTPGTYFDSVEVSSGDADNSPQFAYVALEVTTITANIITLDQVNNVTGGDTVITDSVLPVGDTIRFTFRLTYTDGTINIGGSSNGFEVYEKNGGDFFPIVCDTLPIGWTSMYSAVYINPFSVTGTGRDTVGFFGIDFTGIMGIPVGFDQQVWYIESGSDNDGDTLCIDSSFFPPGGEWLWSPQGGGVFTPDWGGPYCYPIQGEVEIPPTVVINPDTIRVFQANAIDTIWTFIYLGNFTEGHTVNDIDPSSLIINSSMTPTSWAILPSHPGFVGEVMKLTLPIRDFILHYGTLWDMTVQTYSVGGYFTSRCDFSIEGEVTMIGHTSGDLDGDGEVTVSDLTWLVAYLFTGGRPPAMMESADVDHDGMVTVSDLTALVYLLFG